MNSKIRKMVINVATCFVFVCIWKVHWVQAATEVASQVFDIGEGEVMVSDSTTPGKIRVQCGNTTTEIEETKEIKIIQSGEATQHTIKIEAGVTVNMIIDHVTIHAIDQSGINVSPGSQLNMTLVRDNTIQIASGMFAGIHVPQESTLIIKGKGTLAVQSGKNCAGIGSNQYENAGNMIIEEGKINVKGSNVAAAIGCGYAASGINGIALKGGEITAMSEQGPGIGSHDNPINTTFQMTGGTLNTNGIKTAKTVVTGGSIRTDYFLTDPVLEDRTPLKEVVITIPSRLQGKKVDSLEIATRDSYIAYGKPYCINDDNKLHIFLPVQKIEEVTANMRIEGRLVEYRNLKATEIIEGITSSPKISLPLQIYAGEEMKLEALPTITTTPASYVLTPTFQVREKNTSELKSTIAVAGKQYQYQLSYTAYSDAKFSDQVVEGISNASLSEDKKTVTYVSEDAVKVIKKAGNLSVTCNKNQVSLGEMLTLQVRENLSGSTLIYEYEGIGETKYGPSREYPSKAGNYQVTVISPESEQYEKATTIIPFTILKEEVIINKRPQASIIFQHDMLYTSTLTGGEVVDREGDTILGFFVWVYPNDTVSQESQQLVAFVPLELEEYNTVEDTVMVPVQDRSPIDPLIQSRPKDWIPNPNTEK